MIARPLAPKRLNPSYLGARWAFYARPATDSLIWWWSWSTFPRSGRLPFRLRFARSRLRYAPLRLLHYADLMVGPPGLDAVPLRHTRPPSC
ncbi:hypothetical protein [Methanosphaerula subterraneus]|uniref:hypothetical protein n=1 Tax=Methanosphaerula subterraneus TaxID=3350244 RepID=UPI003F8416E9